MANNADIPEVGTINVTGVDRIYPLPDIRAPNDDWTGITGTQERKKRQNRLNQRAYRRRKRESKMHPPQEPLSIIPSSASASGCMYQGDHSQGWSEQAFIMGALKNHVPQEGALLLIQPHHIAFTRYLLQKLYTDYTLNALHPTNLPQLIRLNVLNSLAQNAAALGFPREGLCREEFMSPHTYHGPYTIDTEAALSLYPQNLRPTALQRTLEHHPWLDLFPFPQFRDNMLMGIASGIFDEDELCADILNVGDNLFVEKPALIVWGESWDAYGWEASASFFKKWGWLVRGCPEIVEATNYWREKRGEKRLIFEVE